jgi:hypothetical protein
MHILCVQASPVSSNQSLHFVWKLLLFPPTEHTQQFILLAEEVGQWCSLASCRQIVDDSRRST